ncbi:sensor histidine kinase [Streptomyces sp. NBC_00868]|uniref:sensor histidine kinase n=1 Tax=unclassified Streptomyces TaxID=2593676 RepID=UPI003244A0E4|nr:sensor histidine kinase [Streptomyces sp. NBC_00868]
MDDSAITNNSKAGASGRPGENGAGTLMPEPGTALRAWGGAGLYSLVVGLLIGGVPYASGPLMAAVLLLALTPLTALLRREPLAALGLTLFAGMLVAGAARDHSPGRFLVFLASDLVLGVIVATRPRRTAVIAVSMVLVVETPAVGLLTSGPYDMMSTSLIALLSLGAVYMTGVVFRERREHTVELRSKEVSEAVTAERLRIARELHDMVAHSIGVIAIQAGVGSRVIETQPAEASAALRAIEATSRETLAGLRRTLVALRQAQPDGADGADGQPPLGPAPGLGDLDALVATTADAGVRVEVRREGADRQLPPEIDLSAYRIVQEALTNVVRHADTGQCRVTIGYGAEELTLEIVDEGRGAPGGPRGTGFGITGMRERVGLLHGRFSAGARAGGGFRVEAVLPLPVDAGAVEAAR